MELGDLQIGTKIELEVYKETGDVVEPSFLSQIESVEDQKRAYIATPIFEGKYYPVHVGSDINIYVIDKDGLYKCKAKVLSRTVKENIPMLQIEKATGFERIQRREYFRFRCTLDVKYRLFDKANKSVFTKTYTKDLSGGGVCIFLKEGIELGNTIEGELFFSENEILKFLGEVVRVTPIDRNENYKYEIGILFMKMEKKSREAVVGYIFQEQRRLLKKGWI